MAKDKGKISVACRALIFLFAAWACRISAAPGDDLIVTGSLVNVRSGPSLEAPVVMRLKQGRRLVEVRREGDWVEIQTRRKDIESAWIHRRLIKKIPPPVTMPAAENETVENTEAEDQALFDLFNRAFKEMNENIKKATGDTYFLKAENRGDGIVEVTATADWLSSPRKKRERDMSEIFRIWDAAMVDRMHITVFIVNEKGERLMSMFR